MKLYELKNNYFVRFLFDNLIKEAPNEEGEKPTFQDFCENLENDEEIGQFIQIATDWGKLQYKKGKSK